MNTAKIRSEVVFGLAVAFSVKAVVCMDWPTVVLATAFFAAHWVDRFFSANSVEEKVMKRCKDNEDAIKIVITEVSQLKMANGIISTRKFG